MADQNDGGASRQSTTSNSPSPKSSGTGDGDIRARVQEHREAHPELTDMDVLDYFTAVPGIGCPAVAPGGSESKETDEERHDRERAWEVVKSAVARGGEPRTSVAIVGGGIAGLYCAYQLAQRNGFEVTVYEASSRFGGRIETEVMGGYDAEFGPMRFEVPIQPLIGALAKVLDVHFRPFPPTSNDEASARTGSSRYAIRHDELRHTRDVVGSGDPHPPSLVTTPYDLLRLGVLRMFRQNLWDWLPDETLGYRDIGELDLCVDTTTCPPDQARETSPGTFEAKDGAWEIKPVPAKGTPSTTDTTLQRRTRLWVQSWIDSLSESGYDELRRKARHRTARTSQNGSAPAEGAETAQSAPEGHFLRDEGFWNAMGEELSPAALTYVRNEGTFYHLIPENPNAVEWGVFWLRLLRTEAKELSGIEGGVGRLVENLVERLGDHAHVTLRRAQEVLEVAPGSDAHPVILRIQDRRDNHAYTVEADQCVLALPLAPIRRLSSHFPDQIKEDLTRTFGFDLLKCFLVVNEPWWRYGMPTQTGAGGVPTRELHFKRRSPGWMDGPSDLKPFVEKTGDEGTGMVMVYTDTPAYDFWRPFVESPIHNQAEIKRNPDLQRALVFHLLINARREAHRDLKTLFLDEVARQATDLGVWESERDAALGFVKEVRGWVADKHAQKLLRGWYKRVVSEAPPVLTVENFERILDVLRHPGFDAMVLVCDAVREEVYRELSSLNNSGCACSGINFASTAVSVVFPQKKQSTKTIRGREMPLDDQIDEALGQVITWGIRDWSRPPVEGGCHAWSIGAKSWEVMGRLEAFDLVGRSPTLPVRTMHVCGEAVSDYTGFIEGALRSASRAVSAILEGPVP